MRWTRLVIVVVMAMLPVLLALGYLGKLTIRVYLTDSQGRARYAYTFEGETGSSTDYSWGTVCNATYTSCDICASCHDSGRDRQKEVFTVEQHLKTYFPRMTLTIPEGQKLPWGPAGGYLSVRSGKLEYFLKDGTLDMLTPAGTTILKDGSGRPFLLHMPGEPTLSPAAIR